MSKADDVSPLVDQCHLLAAGMPPRAGDLVHALAARLLDLARAGDRLCVVGDLAVAGDFHTTAELVDALNAWDAA